MIKKTYKVTGMNCQHCVKAVEMELKTIELSKYTVEIGSVEVEFDPEKVKEEEIFSAIDEAGFEVNK